MQPGRRGINGDGKKPVTMTQALQGQRGALAATARPPAARWWSASLPAPPVRWGPSGLRQDTPQNQVSATAQSRKKNRARDTSKTVAAGGSLLRPNENNYMRGIGDGVGRVLPARSASPKAKHR